MGANNTVPSFIKADGPVREARFKFNPDGTRVIITDATTRPR